jgi:hypothetical protein
VPYCVLCKMRKVTSPRYPNFLHSERNFCRTDMLARPDSLRLQVGGVSRFHRSWRRANDMPYSACHSIGNRDRKLGCQFDLVNNMIRFIRVRLSHSFVWVESLERFDFPMKIEMVFLGVSNLAT